MQELVVRAKIDGKTQMDTKMSREKFVDRSRGAEMATSLEEAPAPLRRILEDSFGVPICPLSTNAQKNWKIELVAGPGASMLTQQGMVENALMFHPRYEPEAKIWKHVGKMSVGHDCFSEGELTLQRNGMEGSRTTVAMSGLLQREAFPLPNGVGKLVDISHDVQGELVYDAKLKEWVSGALTLKVSFGMDIRGAGGVAKNSGTMKLRFKRLDE